MSGVIEEPPDEKVKLFYPEAEVKGFYGFWELSGFSLTRDGKSYEEQPQRWLEDLTLLRWCKLWAAQQAKKK